MTTTVRTNIAPDLPKMTLLEAETLIAVLTHCDDHLDGPIALALRELRGWRSELIGYYIRERLHMSQLDNGDVTCLDCGWKGKGRELKAQACPVCDGRCADC